MRNKLFWFFSVGVLIFAQGVTAFAQSDAPSADFFETAWQEAAVSKAYEFTCTVSSGSPKFATVLTGDYKKLADLTVSAIKKYNSVTKGVLIAAKKRLSTSQIKVNSLGILDQLAVGQFDFNEAIKRMKKVSKKKLDIILDGDSIYFKSTGGWKVFQSADTLASIYNGAVDAPFTSSLEKASFVFEEYENSGESKSAIYNGTLTAVDTVSLLTPFIGEEESGKLDPAPVKLFITGDGHIKKFDVVDKIVVGGLTFTVKEKCTLKLKNAKIKLPANAVLLDADSGMAEFTELLFAD